VMLVRDGVDRTGRTDVEVCMLRRNLASEFVAGAYVFPGGSVDPADRGDAAGALCDGLTDAEASRIVGLESGGLALWVAALRECFEEAGVLLARSRDAARGTDLLDTTDPAVRLRFEAHRLAVNEGSTDLSDVCRAEDLVLAVDGVHYVMSYPIESGDHDWLVSRMDVIKLFEPILRPTELANRHTIRGD